MQVWEQQAGRNRSGQYYVEEISVRATIGPSDQVMGWWVLGWGDVGACQTRLSCDLGTGTGCLDAAVGCAYCLGLHLWRSCNTLDACKAALLHAKQRRLQWAQRSTRQHTSPRSLGTHTLRLLILGPALWSICIPSSSVSLESSLSVSMSSLWWRVALLPGATTTAAALTTGLAEAAHVAIALTAGALVVAHGAWGGTTGEGVLQAGETEPEPDGDAEVTAAGGTGTAALGISTGCGVIFARLQVAIRIGVTVGGGAVVTMRGGSAGKEQEGEVIMRIQLGVQV